MLYVCRALVTAYFCLARWWASSTCLILYLDTATLTVQVFHNLANHALDSRATACVHLLEAATQLCVSIDDLYGNLSMPLFVLLMQLAFCFALGDLSEHGAFVNVNH